MNQSAEHQHGSHSWELHFALIAGITYLAGLLCDLLFHSPDSLVIGLYLSTFFFGGFFTVKEAWMSVRQGRFDVDFLMIVAAIGAGAIGKFGEGAVLLFLFSLGHALEEYAMSRASRSIETLAEMTPRTATVKMSNGDLAEVLISSLQTGDTVVVRPNSRIPADGVVVVGTPSIDQSAVTGESIPSEKTPVGNLPEVLAGTLTASSSEQVFAGTINGPTAFELAVTAAGQDTTLSRVIALVKDAEVAKSPTQGFIDRFQRYYVPGVIAAVLIVMLFGALALDESFTDSFYRAMVVLVAASPCALAIATPSAVLSAISRAASAGVLVKGGAPLEILGQVDTIAFDKTGTLTWGMPSISAVIPASPSSAKRLEAVTLTVESLSDHPLAKALVNDLRPRVDPDAHTRGHRY